MKDAPTLLKIPKSECPDIWIRLPKHKWPKSWSSMEDPVVPLERNLYGHPLAGLLWEKPLEKVLLEHGWGKVPNWECLFVNRAKGLFLSMHVDDITLAGKTENIEPTWKILMEDVDLGEPTSFLEQVFLGCTQRECQTSKDIVANYRDRFESRISVGAKEKPLTRASGKPDAEKYLLGPMTWKVTQRNVWKDIANLQIKRLNNEIKSQRYARMTIIFMMKKMDLLEKYLKFAHKLF